MSCDEDGLREVKTLISSLLISNPNKSTIKSLNNEFREEIGYSIPFRRYGYDSIDSFLRSMPDTLNVLGSGYNATLQVLVSKKVAHIDSLISKQRSSSGKKKIRGPHSSSRFRDNCTRAAPRLAYQLQESSRETTKAPVETVERYTNNLVQNSLRSNSPPIQEFGSIGSVSESSSDGLKKPASQKTPLIVNNDIVLEKRTVNSVLKSQDSEASSTNQSSGSLIRNLSNLKLTSNVSHISDDIGISNFKVPHQVQENLLKIVRDHPNGVDCSMVPSLYRKIYKEELSYNTFGYRNLIQMIKDFPNTYHCFRPDYGDYKIFDKSQPLPANLDSFDEPIENHCNGFVGNKNKSSIFPDSALPEILYNTFNIDYPPDVVKLKEIIPRQFISDDVKELDEIELRVAEVYDPSKFWVILMDHYKDLNDLMNKLQMHYSHAHSKSEINEQHLEAGMFCVATYGSEYHRALLTKVMLSEHKANVFYIDYGTVSVVDSRHLYFLVNSFAYLPQLAVRARLAGITPSEAQSPWPIDTTLKFLSLVQSRTLTARICKIDRDEQVVDVILIDNNRGRSYVINDALVKANLAITINQVQKRRQFSSYIPCVDPIYHFPTFHELENLLVSTLSEFIAKNKLGLTHNAIYPHYYELQFRYPEDSDSSQSISDPVKRRRYLKVNYPNVNNEVETNKIPSITLPTLKPPPGFVALPQIPLSDNGNTSINPFFYSNNDNTRNDSVSNFHQIPNIPSPPHNTMINRQEFAQMMATVLKRGNLVVVYILDRVLKEFLVANDFTENLIKCLKKNYITVDYNIIEDMMNDILNQFDNSQFPKVCDFIQKNVPELRIDSSHNGVLYNPLSSEGSLPLSSLSQSSPPRLQIDDLSPYAAPFVPSALVSQFPSNIQLSPVLQSNFTKTESLLDSSILKSSNVCNQDSTDSDSFTIYNSQQRRKKFSPRLYSSSIATESLPEDTAPIHNKPEASSMYFPDETTLSETSTIVCESKLSSTQLKNKFVLKKKLHGNAVHLINLDKQIYITLLEMLKVTKLKEIDLQTIEKNIDLCYGAQQTHHINLNDHWLLNEELQRSGFEYDDEILSLIRIEFIPDFFKLFKDVLFPESSFKKFLDEIYYSEESSV